MNKLLFVLSIFVILTSCNLDTGSDISNSLNISASNISRDTIQPSSPTYAKYEIIISKDSNDISSGVILNPNYDFNNIDTGTWSITANGLDINNNIVGTGTKNFDVTAGDNNTQIEITPKQTGSGEIDISLSWSGATIKQGNINDVSGKIINLSTSVQTDISTDLKNSLDVPGKEVSYTKTNVTSGDYIIKINLKSGTETVLTYNRVIGVFQNLKSARSETLTTTDFISPPQKPTNLTVIDDPSGYKLSWKDNSLIEEYFIIERQEEANFGSETWQNLGNTVYPDEEMFLDDNVDKAKKYRYRVTAYNSFGIGVSDYYETTDTLPPNAGILKIESKTTSEATISWTKATDLVTNQGDLEYCIYYSETDGIPEEIAANGSVLEGFKTYVNTEKLISTFNTNKDYYVTIAVKDEIGLQSFYNKITVLITDDVTPPDKPRLDVTGYRNKTHLVSWSVPGATKVKAYYSYNFTNPLDIEVQGTFAGETVSAFNKYVNDMQPGDVNFVLVASDDAGNKSYSDVETTKVKGSVIVINKPEAKTITNYTSDHNKINNITNIYVDLSWEPSTDVETPQDDLRYRIYYSKDYSTAEDLKEHGTDAYNLFNGVISGGKISKRIDNLLYGTRYYFTVEVMDTDHNSTFYPVVSLTTVIPQTLPKIKIKDVTPGEGSIEVDLDQVVTVYFYEELSEPSIQDTTVFVEEVDEHGTVIGEKEVGGLAYSSEKRAIIFTPTKDILLEVLKDGVPTQVKDEHGNDVLTGYKQNSYYQVSIVSVSSQGGEFIDWSFTFKTIDYGDFKSHWKFDGNGRDFSGQERHIVGLDGTFNGTKIKEGTDSVYMNGDNSGEITNLDLGDQFTVTAWVNMDFPIANSLNTIISNATSPEIGDGFKLCVNTWDTQDKTITVELGNGTTGGKFYTGPGFVKEGGWYHLAFVINKAEQKIELFFDGEKPKWDDNNTPNNPDDDIAGPPRFTSQDGDGKRTEAEFIRDGGWNFKTSGPYNFGSFPDSSYYDYGFTGFIDDMRVYNKVLTDDEIRQIATQNY